MCVHTHAHKLRILFYNISPVPNGAYVYVIYTYVRRNICSIGLFFSRCHYLFLFFFFPFFFSFFLPVKRFRLHHRDDRPRCHGRPGKVATHVRRSTFLCTAARDLCGTPGRVFRAKKRRKKKTVWRLRRAVMTLFTTRLRGTVHRCVQCRFEISRRREISIAFKTSVFVRKKKTKSPNKPYALLYRNKYARLHITHGYFYKTNFLFGATPL